MPPLRPHTRLLLPAILLAVAPAALAETQESGAIEVVVDGKRSTLPMVKTEVDTDLHGDLATVRLTQTFANPLDVTVNATYAFPLPSNAAVHGMDLVAGDVHVTAIIQEKAQAQATFDKAKREGKQAALLQQHRPNVFTQDVANLPPGAEIRVSIHYVHAVPKVDGAYEWVLPVAVGPRYIPGDRAHAGEPEPLEMGSWNVPQAATDTPLPTTIEAGRLAVSVDLDAGMPVASLTVPSHPGARVQQSKTTHRVGLSGELANQDVVVRYQLAEDGIAAGTTAYGEHGHGVLSLLVDPPAAVEPDRLTPREMVFVLDTSGSMGGAPMDTVKRFVHQSLDTLRPGDHFRLVRFGNNASEYGRGAVPYNAETVAGAHAWIDALQANGGTEMRTGVNAALDAPPIDGTVRTVVFLTDGYIGNEADVIRLIESKDSGARLFALGVGGSVNRWLLEEMARVGRGTARVVTDVTTADEQADALAAQLAAPYLTDVRIDWGDAPVRNITPEVLPDLFLGEPLRVMAQYDGTGTHTVTVHGRIAGAEATLPLRVTLPEDALEAEALPKTWARSQVSDRMHRYLAPTTPVPERESLQEQVTTLGLEYGLTTQWTSFVAVVPEPVVAQSDPASPAPGAAPQPAPAVATNWSPPSTSFGGSAAPEPAGWAAMGLMAALGGLLGRRRRKKA